MRRIRRRPARTFVRVHALVVIAVVASLLGAVAMPPAGAAAARTGQEHHDEWDFLARANAERRAAGLPALRMAATIRESSRDHAEDMAAAGTHYHDASWRDEAERLAPCWTRIGENVGQGGSVSALHAAFMASPIGP